MKEETFILLAGFNLIDIAKEYLPHKLIDEHLIRNPNYPNWQVKFKRVLQYWRFDDSIPFDFYSVLRKFYPAPIPFSLFFSYNESNEINNIKWIGDLADKWLMDIFSGESFYKRNKEYFTKSEVKRFLVCNWIQPYENEQKMCNYSDLAYHFFDAKIKANNLVLSPSNLVDAVENFFAHSRILKDFLVFIHNNKKRIRDEEIYSISYYINSEYISNGKNFDFNKQTYKSLKWLTDVWYTSCYLEERNDRFAMPNDNKIVQDYIQFICKNLIRENIKKFSHSEITDFGHYFRAEIYNDSSPWEAEMYTEIYDDPDPADYEYDQHIEEGLSPLFVGPDIQDINDIFDFLRVEYIDAGIDFDFNNRAWRSLKRLSDEWHYENQFIQAGLDASEVKKLLDTNWEKSQINDFAYEKDGKIWTITEITSGELLHEEGKIMHHCCFSYVKDCINKNCMIFSVKCDDKKDEKRIATVEIRRMKITQVRGEYNSSINKETRDIIKRWANENQIGY